ncbi:hypothetical protein LSH36_3g21004 [Paralvinella palmiformis]|uniref:non-specific serine/threonine protein kinase n=1 Tax=Paralvinella palmiformis TaxID=53620 RepID=A0AAD9NHE6_9ANNE|nr:hypothetical protein LSH36_3g21004 [Paralvinella palmiformis]
MDKYVKIKKIGEGSFGKALLVRSKSTNEQMVVKEINMNKMSRKEREEARKEVAVLAQLRHPNVVSYKESFEEIGNLYIVMDYCDGGDLYGRINMQRGILFPEDQVLDWFVQTCLAIKHIHDRKILHRDIKSQNIFLTKTWYSQVRRLCTVELARTCIGTPYYLSPEICENKPYNNKSDIWSLGCVLYELTTLKHAFEAGNMKNLVLKIIRGSYPPPPPRFSYELRGLIAQMFKRSPRDRPSVNTILKKSLLQTRIRKFLSEKEIQGEFCHTVMHGVKIKKEIPLGGARPLPPKPQIEKSSKAVKLPVQSKMVKRNKPSPNPRPKYDPASVYLTPMARKLPGKENRKSSEVRKSSGNNVKKPTPAVGNNAIDLIKKRQEFIEKEKRRREEARKKEQLAHQEQYAKRHQELIEKQKAARILKGREEGWKGFIDTLSSDDSDKYPLTPKKDDSPKPELKPGTPKPAVKNRANYEQYHAYLDNLEQHRLKAVSPALGVAGALEFGTPAVVAQAAKQGAVAGAKGAEAAERARIVREYMQRKKEAELNKARAHGDLFGGAAAAISPRIKAAKQPVPVPKPSAGRPTSAQDSRQPLNDDSPYSKAPANKNEEDYSAKLRQIRLQNFNERRNIKDKLVGGKADPKYKPAVADQKNADLRRKKIEALKAQADERAKKLREELEKKRKEAYNLEQHRLKQQAKGNPPVPMTEAMKAIGVIREDNEQPKAQMEKCPVGLTAAMEAIGAAAPAETEESKSLVQKKKEAILKRLNQKPPVPEKVDRSKWGEPVKVMINDRLKWEAGNAADLLRQRSLEETGSHMEATNAADVVIKHNDIKETTPEGTSQDSSTPASARRQWGGRANTVLNVLEQANITEVANTTSVQDPKSKPDKLPQPEQSSVSTSEAAGGGKAPAIGTTITIARNKGTLIIRKAESEQEVKGNDHPGGVGNDATTEEHSKDVTATDSSLNVSSGTKQRSRSSSPMKKEEGKSALFEHVDLDEEEGGSKEEEIIVVEDLDVVNDVPAPVPEKQNDPDKQSTCIKDTSEVDDQESAENKQSVLNKSLNNADVVVGLTTGHYDADIKVSVDSLPIQLLRTCSEPDLSKLFRTNLADNPFFEEISALNNSCIEKGVQDDELLEESSKEEEEEEEDQDIQDEDINPEEGEQGTSHEEPLETESAEDVAEVELNKDSNDSEKEDENDMENDSIIDSDEEDLQSMRESMQVLLQSTDDVEEEDETSVVNPRRKVKRANKKGRKTKMNKSKVVSKKLISSQSSDNFVKDFQSMKETMKTLLMPAAGKKEKTLKSGKDEGSDDNKNKSHDKEELSNIVDAKESWQSDEDDDDYFEEEDMFSCLEATRAKLEQELGCESFLKAYRAVQAIHEDEDENMEEGKQSVSKILGQDKEHLYLPILRLVMADGVFTEDKECSSAIIKSMQMFW